MKIWQMLGLWILFCTVTIVGIVWVRLYLGRREAKKTKPQRGEIWTQDGQPLIIRAVAKHGVLLMGQVPGGVHSWWDSWDEWDVRVRTRLVFRTEQTMVLPES